MSKSDDFLGDRLADRRAAGLLRRLTPPTDLIDFCSNDYLGLSRAAGLRQMIDAAMSARVGAANGATGSRLLAGNSALAEQVEAELALFYQTEAALVFNSGYDANIGLLASVPRLGDTLITDELVHASMIDGARLSYATRYRFRHNDLNDLETKLTEATGRIFVAVESVYSMDGDLAPLCAMADLCDRYGAALIVDEAHATGVFGPTGTGLVCELGLQNRVFARLHTFGKALGVHGAAVVGSAVLREYLINFARSFVYTTALPPTGLVAIRSAHTYLNENLHLQTTLQEQVTYFRKQAFRHLPDADWLDSPSPIQGLVVPGNDTARQVASSVQQAGFDVRAILSPTVPAGRERLRICLHTVNTESEIDRLLSALQVALFHFSHEHPTY